MTNFEKAIRLAIDKGGYTFGEFFRTSFEVGEMKWRFRPYKDPTEIQIWSLVNVDISPSMTWEYSFAQIAQDPLFWRALGKALGWGDYADWDLEYDDSKLNSWRWHAGQYFMLLIDGGDLEAFFGELLK